MWTALRSLGKNQQPLTAVSSVSMPQMALSWMVATPMPLAPPPAACHATRSICACGPAM
jgi:hypothetical protein